MSSNLPPELLALLQSQQVGNTGSYMGDQFGSSHYTPIYGPGSMSGGGGAEGGDWQQGPLTGYYGTENGKTNKWADQYNGANRNEYDAQGNYVKTDQWSGLTGGQEMLPLMMMLGPIAMQAMGAGFGAGGAGGAGGAAGTAGAAMTPAEAFALSDSVYAGSGLSAGGAGTGAAAGLASGAYGTLPAVEVPTWSAAEFAGSQPFNWAPSASSAAGGAAGAAGAGGGGGGMSAAGDAFMPGKLAASGGAEVAMGSTIPGLSQYALPASASWLSTAKGLIGPAAALAGAVAGAQGTPGTETTRKQELPDYLKGPVEKMLGYGTSLLDKQMAPGALAGYDLMQQKGLGLLNTPQLGNGFSRFFPGR